MQTASDTIFIDISTPDTRNLITGLDLVTFPKIDDLLERYVIPQILEAPAKRANLIQYALNNFGLLSLESIQQLSQAKIVPVNKWPNGTVLMRPRDTIAPKTLVALLFFQDETKVADEKFCESHRSGLQKLGMIDTITEELVSERITKYANSDYQYPEEEIVKKAEQLIATCREPPWLSEETLQSSRWIPAKFLDGTKGRFSAYDCRDPSFEAQVKYAMPLTSFAVSSAWRSRFEWDQPLPAARILHQVEGAVNAVDRTALEYLVMNKDISAGEFPEELKKIAWVPDTEGSFYSPERIFFDDFRTLSPHFGTVDAQFKKIAKQLLVKVGVHMAPSLLQLKRLQDGLADKGKLEANDLEMALFIVKHVGKKFSKKVNLDEFWAPDRNGWMRIISQLTAGDPGSTATHLMVLHPAVSLDTVNKLGLKSFHDRYVALLNDPYYEDDFAQRESPKAVIEDTLRRYTIASTFNEFLANAEDSRSASLISWILDKSDDYPKADLLSKELSEVQGPALFCYNDGSK